MYVYISLMVYTAFENGMPWMADDYLAKTIIVYVLACVVQSRGFIIHVAHRKLTTNTQTHRHVLRLLVDCLL